MATLQKLEPGATFAEEFRIVRPLAAGGMGAVYVAEQLSTSKVRALKVMLPDVVADPRHRERFMQEARVGARIQSPHVVEVTDAGVDESTGTPWIAMELLEGETLAERVRREGALDSATFRTVMEQLGDALGSAHAAGVVHRDLKPENLMVATSRLRGVPFVLKVLDFGIATILSERASATTVTTVIGSPMWMAPEQANRGAKVSAAADVWALGLIAFYACTGHCFWPALEGAAESFNLSALLVDIMVHPIPTASARAEALGVADRLPQGFDAWFARCVARTPEARFPDGGMAVRALLDPAERDATPSTSPPDPLATTMNAATSRTPTPPHTPSLASVLVATPAVVPSVVPSTTDAVMQVPVAPPPDRGVRVLPVLIAATLTAAAAIAAWNLRAPTPPAASPPPRNTAHIAPLAPDATPRNLPDAAPVVAPDVALTATDVSAAHDDVASGTARLDVRCRPRCRVTLDGVTHGRASRPLEVTPGTHTVVAERGDVQRTQTVTVAAGETREVTFALDTEDDTTAPSTSPPPRPAPVPVVHPALPDRPSHASVASAFGALASAFRGCGGEGRAVVQVTFAGDGHALSAMVEGPLGTTQVGLCLARAARGAHVEPFARESLVTTWPVTLGR